MNRQSNRISQMLPNILKASSKLKIQRKSLSDFDIKVIDNFNNTNDKNEVRYPVKKFLTYFLH